MKSLAEWAVRVVLPRSDRRHVLDGLDELHAIRTETMGAAEAGRWRRRQLWRLALRALPTCWWRRPLRGFLRVMTHRDRHIGPADLLRQDLRFAWRTFLRRPGFTVAAVLILAVGIGAATAIFSVVDTVVLRPLPYPEPRELVHFGGYGGVRPLLYTRWRDGLRSYEGVEASWNVSYNLTGEGPPRRLRVSRVSPDLLSILGAGPHLGRLFLEEDYREGTPVRLLGYGFWQRQWGGDASVLGRTILVEGKPTLVVGILSPAFDPPEVVTGREVELWLPLDADSEGIATWSILSVVARLRGDVGLRAAQAELDAFSAHLAEELPELAIRPDGTLRTTRLLPLQIAASLGVAGPLALLTWAVALLLAIACANVANLLLAQGTARGREIALRGALGAGRGRIVRQLLTESMVLALAGGLLGVGIAYVSVHLFRGHLPSSIPRIEELAVDLRVLFIALGTSLATGVLFGLPPALQVSRHDVIGALKEGGLASAGSRRGGKTQGTLVVTEIALALVLLATSGLLSRSLVASVRVDPGFRSAELVTVPLHLGSGYAPASRQQFTREVLRRLAALPGAQGAAAGLTAPFQYVGASKCCIANELEGLGGEELAPIPMGWTHPVSPGYFRVLGAQVRYGREFLDSDEDGEGLVAILSEPAARQLFGTPDALGRSVRIGGWGTHIVVGVVRGVRHYGVQEGIGPEVYIPYGRWGSFSDIYHLLIRSSAPLETLAPLIRESIWAVDPGLPVEDIVPMTRWVEASLLGQKFLSTLLATFALVALVLATGGIYASMHHSVGRRRQEMGIRVAMGAERGQLVGLVLRSGLTLTATGIALGLGASVAVARALQSFLYGVALLDPLTLGGVMVLLATAALLACLVPALKAGRADPLDSLRRE